MLLKKQMVGSQDSSFAFRRDRNDVSTSQLSNVISYAIRYSANVSANMADGAPTDATIAAHGNDIEVVVPPCSTVVTGDEASAPGFVSIRATVPVRPSLG
jgi:hypothetical protein